MRRSILSSILIFTVVVFTTACKTKKAVVVPPPVVNKPVVDNAKIEGLKLLKSKQMQFNTLVLKGKAKLDIDGDVNDVTMNIRIQNKEKIWVSVTAIAGIEVARALITPDSIKILNRLKSDYIKKPFSFIYGFTNKQINFGTLQSVFSGNCIDTFLTYKSDLKLDSGVWVLSGRSESLDYKTLFNILNKVMQTNLNDVKAAQALKVTYANHQQVNNNMLFPSDMKINTLSGSKKININFNFSKVEVDTQLDFPFSVPKRYEVIN